MQPLVHCFYGLIPCSGAPFGAAFGTYYVPRVACLIGCACASPCQSNEGSSSYCFDGLFRTRVGECVACLSLVLDKTLWPLLQLWCITIPLSCTNLMDNIVSSISLHLRYVLQLHSLVASVEGKQCGYRWLNQGIGRVTEAPCRHIRGEHDTRIALVVAVVVDGSNMS